MFSFLKNIFGGLGGKPFGLYITDEYVQAVQFNGNEKAVDLHAISEQPLPQGVVVKGEIVQQKALSEIIKTLLKEAKPNPILETKCLVTIPSNQCYEHVFYLSVGLSDNDFKTQLDIKVKENIPLPFTEVKYDYSSHTVEKVVIVYVVAVRREVIAQYYDTLKTLCGLDPEVLEPESLSLLRNIKVDFEENKAIILADLHGDKITWFEMWYKSVLDSNIIEKEGLLEDLKISVNTFKTNTGGGISEIFVSGNTEAATKLAEELKSGMGVPTTVLGEYRITPKLTAESDPLQFKISSGLALKGIGIDIKTQINLFKK